MTTTRSTVPHSATSPTNGWSTVPFGELVENHDGRRVPLKSEDRRQRSGPYPYYGASGIIDQIDDFLFDGEFLLIGEDGANLVARATPIAFLASGRFWVNNHAHVVRPKDGVLLDYLIHWFAQADISQYVTGSAQPKLSQGKLNEIPVPLPPLAEQRRIAGRLREQLAEVAKARTAVQAQLAAAQALPTALLGEAFGGPDANSWPRMTLAEFTIEMRYGTSNQSTKHGYPTLRIPNVVGGGIDLSDLKYVMVEDRELEKLRLLDGDILFVRTNGNPHNVGRSAVFSAEAVTHHGIEPTNVIFASYLIRARFDRHRIEPRFVEYYLQSGVGRSDLLSRSKTSAGQFNISTNGLGSLVVPVPSLDAQRQLTTRITAELAEVTRLRESLNGKLETLDRLPAALLAQAFQGGSKMPVMDATDIVDGTLRVPNAPHTECAGYIEHTL